MLSSSLDRLSHRLSHSFKVAEALSEEENLYNAGRLSGLVTASEPALSPFGRAMCANEKSLLPRSFSSTASRESTERALRAFPTIAARLCKLSRVKSKVDERERQREAKKLRRAQIQQQWNGARKLVQHNDARALFRAAVNDITSSPAAATLPSLDKTHGSSQGMDAAKSVAPPHSSNEITRGSCGADSKNSPRAPPEKLTVREENCI